MIQTQTYNSDLFVDREQQTKFILDRVNLLLESLSPGMVQRIIHLCGSSGIGKTWFLQEVKRQLSHDKSVVPIYLALNELQKEDQISSAFMYAINNKVVGSEHLDAPIVKDEIATSFEQSRWLLSTIQTLSNKIFVFMLDDIESLNGQQIELLEDTLLTQLVNLPNVVMVLASRYPISIWKIFQLRPRQGDADGPFGNIYLLPPFDLETTRTQLKRHKPGSEQLSERIHALSGGSPKYNDLIAQYVTGDPLSIPDELEAIRRCNQVMLQDIPLDLLPVLDALCVLDDFSNDVEEISPLLNTLTHPHGQWDRNQCIQALGQLMQVYVGPGKLISWNTENEAYIIDKQVRIMLERELKMRDITLWKKLHCTAMNMYQEWEDEYLSTIFGKKAEYHARCLQDAGFDPNQCVD